MLDKLKEKLKLEGLELLIKKKDGSIEVTLKSNLNGDIVGTMSGTSEEAAIISVVAKCLGEFASIKNNDFEQAECFIDVNLNGLFPQG